jgi:hypothetical protein
VERPSTLHHLKIGQLKEKINRLAEEQRIAMERAVYLGMTPGEDKENEVRRKQLKQLVDELLLFAPPKLSFVES